MKPKSIIKVLLSIAMVLMIFRSVDLMSLKNTFRAIPVTTAVIVVVGYFVGQLLSSVKWWFIVRSGGIPISYPASLRAYFVGMFVNCFGLGMVGGDVARGVLVAQGLPKKTEGIASVVVDRIHGLTVLSMIALTTSLTLGNEFVPPHFVQFLAVLCAGFISAWLLGPLILSKLPSLGNSTLTTKFQHLAALFPRDPKTLATITIISIAFHTLQICLHAVMAAGLGANISLATLFVVIPFVNIASSLPISWNGLGVREKSYIFFLSPTILSSEQALAFGALWLLAVTVASAVGGLVALISGDLKTLKLESQLEPANRDAIHHRASAAEG